MEKEKFKRISLRMTMPEFESLQIQADKYTEGNVSQMIRMALFKILPQITNIGATNKRREQDVGKKILQSREIASRERTNPDKSRDKRSKGGQREGC